MNVGFVGNGADKFTPVGEMLARQFIANELWMHDQDYPGEGVDAMVSGHSPVGGIDIWAEEEAEAQGIALNLKIPEIPAWNPHGYGFKARNIDIATDSDVLYVVLADVYPEEYAGMRFDKCYHCVRFRPNLTHVKSGGCWTGNYAIQLGRYVRWKVIENY